MQEVAVNNNIIRCLNLGKRIHAKIFQHAAISGATYEGAHVTHQAASDLIRRKLLDDEPLMIARFGSIELRSFLNYYFMNKGTLFGRSLNYMRGKTLPFWLEKDALSVMCNNAGFFPEEEKYVERYYQRMLADIQLIDILGSTLKEEELISSLIEKAVKVRLPDLEPYYHEHPWTEALKGKKVLVVHPYAESIQLQYKKRELLFENKEILPAFELKTIKAVQSIAGNKTPFPTWFDALEHMCVQVSDTDFDVALIGCGAYGLPLAAHVKRLGKKGIQMGGATQILFGIKGKRWEEHEVISKLMNQHWVRPMASEVPANHTNVENGCYW
jgi:hypothetical protein